MLFVTDVTKLLKNAAKTKNERENKMKSNSETSQKEINCNHAWESKPGGFTPESGFWNYSQCVICGETTTDYDHGDFQGKNKNERNRS